MIPSPSQLDRVSEVLFIVDPKFRVIWANQRAQREWNWVPYHGIKCFELFKYCQPRKCPVQKVFETQKPARGIIHVPQQGAFLLSASPLWDEKDTIKAALVLALKLGARETSQVLGAYRYEVIGRLAVGFIHDIKNLVSYLMGELDILELISRENRLKRRYKKMRTILEGISTVCQKINTLGDIAREPELLHLNVILKELHPIISLFLPDQVDLEVHVDPDTVPIRFNRAALEQIILNLILNAVDALPQKQGHIKVWTKKEKTYMHLIVEDNGVGIPKEHLGQIFDPFFSTKDKGSGLGLSLIKSWVEETGGHISVESTEGRGSRFIVAFPIPECFLERPSRP